MLALGCICVALVPVAGYERDVMATATAPYRFSAAGWELAHLPDKWFRRLVRIPTALAQARPHEQKVADVHEFFATNRALRSIDRQLIALGIASPATPETAVSMAALRRQQAVLQDRSDQLRPGVEETLESALADTLNNLGFQAWTGPFPPVDTVLTGSPTVLVTSPRDRIVRQETVTLHTGLTNEERDRIESHVEEQTDLSALVLDTGGIALYPSIAIPYAGLDFALEVVAHEWVHHWLWFRPLGRRYFQGGDLTAMNETVANIAGREIGDVGAKAAGQICACLAGRARPRSRRQRSEIPVTLYLPSTFKRRCAPPGSTSTSCWRPARWIRRSPTWRSGARSSWPTDTGCAG